MPDSGVSPSEVAALTQRVTGVEAAVDSIRKDIHSLVGKFDERTRMPWGTLIAGAGFMFTVMSTFVTMLGGVVAWGLLSQNANIVKSFDEFKSTYETNRIVTRQDNDARFQQIYEVLGRSVPRGEHERVWAADIQRFTDIQRQVDELKASDAALYGANDYLEELSEWRNRTDSTVTEILTLLNQQRRPQ